MAKRDVVDSVRILARGETTVSGKTEEGAVVEAIGPLGNRMVFTAIRKRSKGCIWNIYGSDYNAMDALTINLAGHDNDPVDDLQRHERVSTGLAILAAIETALA